MEQLKALRSNYLSPKYSCSQLLLLSKQLQKNWDSKLVINPNNQNLNHKKKGHKVENLHLRTTCTLTSRSLSCLFEFHSIALGSMRRLSGLGVRKGVGDAITPNPDFLKWSGVRDIIFNFPKSTWTETYIRTTKLLDLSRTGIP